MQLLSGDSRCLQRLAGTFGQVRLVWAIQCYAQEAVLPRIRDFEEWLSGQKDFPDAPVCAAYLSGDPEIVALADSLETLRAAWFPEEDTARAIKDLEGRLKGLIC